MEILVNEGFEGKVWNQGKQEAVATKMRKRRLTKAKSFSAQSVRTLFANGPKYLGFVYTDADTDSANVQRKIIVTKAGKQLAAENLLAGGHYLNLDEWEKYHKLPPSDAISRQLFKLIMNNPISTNYGVGSLYPYRNTLKLCQELGYLDKEEIGFLLFAMKSDKDYEDTRDLILEFRTLTPSKRKATIDNYRKSEAGQVTLVKAPTTHYFMSFCKSSGYFSVVEKGISEKFSLPALQIKNSADAKALISTFNSSETFEFGSDKSLWIEYFGDISKSLPPREVEIDFSFNKPGEFVVRIQRNSQVASVSSTESTSFSKKVAAFDGDQIELEIYAGNGEPVKSDKFDVEPRKARYALGKFIIDEKAPLVFDRSTKHLIDCLNQVATKGWDDVFLQKLEIYKALTGVDAKNNRLKGGRLEQLTSHLFENMTADGLIDGFKWYGKVDANDLPSPAPGGKEGNPDLVFEFEDYAAVIELTTIKGTAAQWSSSEAASVPDHIFKYRHSNPKSKIMGFFVAPSIHSRIFSTFKAQASIIKTPIICLKIEEFAMLALDSRDDLRKKLRDWENIS